MSYHVPRAGEKVIVILDGKPQERTVEKVLMFGGIGTIQVTPGNTTHNYSEGKDENTWDWPVSKPESFKSKSDAA